MPFICTLLLSCALLVASHSAWAQMGFTKGTCVLQNGQQVQGSFQLRTASAQSPAILVHYDGREEREFEPTEVKYFTLGRRSYIVGNNFVAPDDKDGIPVDHDFVEVVDTAGGVQLFRYEYVGYLTSNRVSYAIPTGTSAGGTMHFGGGADGYRRTDILLLRAGPGKPMVPYTPGPRAGLFAPEEEKAMLTAVGATTAFFVNDPELQKRIETGKLPEARLEAAVRAYNAGVRLQPKN